MNSPFLSVNLNKLVSLMQVKAEILLKKEYNIDYSQFLILHMITVIDDPNQQDIARQI
jgi:DNA-binding MarR family transcriptional regulator